MSLDFRPSSSFYGIVVRKGVQPLADLRSLRSLRPLPVRKVEFHLGDLAQRICPLIPSSNDFVHKVPHLFFDLVQCNGRGRRWEG